MNSNESTDHSNNTLDPPGSIVVIGDGPLGIEAALYGRFLGYQVTLVQEQSLDHFMLDHRQQDLPLLPDRCMSSLALSALDAQNHELGPQSLPMTVADWIEKGLCALCGSDLLINRVRTDESVHRIELTPAEIEGDEDVPDDFRVSLDAEPIDCEALILVSDRNEVLQAMLPEGTEYCFKVAPFEFEKMEASLLQGYHRIVEIFAGLIDRADLDLYRPKRG